MLSLQDIHHSYESVPALKGVDLEVNEGEIVCLLGQSGCGKSTLMNLAAGLLDLQRGEITLGDKLLSSPKHHVPPEKRPMGLVFQEGALFPHLTIEKNIVFGVSDIAKHSQITRQLLEQIGLSGYEDRYPHTLSGGQRQRVALARALARQPSVLLMDEPFASIDVLMRRHIREDIYHLLKARHCTTILITHDPEEAIEIADKIAVMEAGKITQFGTAKHLYDSPKSLFVGLMSGDGAVLKGRRKDQYFITDFGRFDLADLKIIGSPQRDGDMSLLLRHNSVRLSAVKVDGGIKVRDIRETGEGNIVTLENSRGQLLLLHVEPQAGIDVGQCLELDVKGRCVSVFVT